MSTEINKLNDSLGIQDIPDEVNNYGIQKIPDEVSNYEIQDIPDEVEDVVNNNSISDAIGTGIVAGLIFGAVAGFGCYKGWISGRAIFDAIGSLFSK